MSALHWAQGVVFGMLGGMAIWGVWCVLEMSETVQCLLRGHEPGRYSGEIRIYRLDRDRHAIEYGNVVICPRCKKILRIDNSH